MELQKQICLFLKKGEKIGGRWIISLKKITEEGNFCDECRYRKIETVQLKKYTEEENKGSDDIL